MPRFIAGTALVALLLAPLPADDKPGRAHLQNSVQIAIGAG